MSKSKLYRSSWCYIQKRLRHEASKEVTPGKNAVENTSKIRNIGILAHIDAGKTTTTERMLYYSGLINTMGEVHHGNTVTDYLEQERQRGITITSATVTYNWRNHRINLIDTPGHIDFTMEVEESVKILDGAIVILDGSAGVEAQTLTVCTQADKYSIPRIIYVNKMDRPNADFQMNLKSIKSRLSIEPLPLQFPIKEDGVLNGIVDVIFLEKIIFDKSKQGTQWTKGKLTEKDDGKLWEMASENRRNIIDRLSDMDDKLANMILEQESLDGIDTQSLIDALRKITITQQAAPVLLGSSYKNIGVQPLMDAAVYYLPSPNSNPIVSHYRAFKSNFSARVFKIVHDRRKGAITFLRIYTGSIKKGQRVYNMGSSKAEQIERLYIPFANEYEEIDNISEGNIVAVTGLESTVTGDLITSNQSAAENAKSLLLAANLPAAKVEELFVARRQLLNPVFFCNVEAESLATQGQLDKALKQLEREDPGLRITYDEENNTTVLAGMGELHLEIVKDRLRTDYKLDADLSSLRISYQESVESAIKDSFHFKHSDGSKNCEVTLEMSIVPNENEKKLLRIDQSREYASMNANINPIVLNAIKIGVENAFRCGPKLGCPVVNVTAVLHNIKLRCTYNHLISTAVMQCVSKLLKNCESVILEPVMYMEVTVPDGLSSPVLADLSKRHAEILSIDAQNKRKIFMAHAPLAELLGYSTTLRTITSGEGSFSYEFSHYRKMDESEELRAIKDVRGF